MNPFLRHTRALAVMALSAITLALAAGLATASSSTAAADEASGVKVYVGYADNVRAESPKFPTPWAGSPSVIFEGCQPTSNCAYDAGAVMVFNGTPSTVTVSSIVVHFSTCTYDIWPHDLSVPAGSQLVVTQTASGAGNGCEPVTGRMDSSDIGPNGVGWAGRCDPSGVVPQVDVTINGATSTLADSGKVLNTGGVDQADCGGGNESTQWSLVGTICPTSQLGLEPQTQTLVLGTTASVVATFTNSCGAALPGVPVTFTVVSGPNAGLTGSGVTDGSGKASFSYASAVLGADTLQATITNTVGTITSNAVSVDWVNQPPDCANAAATPNTLWPPNHQMLAVAIEGVSDPDGDAVTTTVIGVTQDEPLNGLGDGDTAPDAQLASSGRVLLRAERSGLGDGRVYVVSFTASDGKGGTCSGSVSVAVPHDQGRGAIAIDSGHSVNSLGS
jgi:hypothetical protein